VAIGHSSLESWVARRHSPHDHEEAERPVVSGEPPGLSPPRTTLASLPCLLNTPSEIRD
jgi:hypothetical protein